LQKGGEFDYRELVAGHEPKKPTMKITVPPSPDPAIVAERVEKDKKNHQLYTPKTSDFASIDAWMPGFGAFQMTVGKTHNLRDSVTDDIAKLGDNGDKLYWLLPPLYYDLFTKKKPKKFKFDQYAMLIPYLEAVQQSWDEVSKIENEINQDADMEGNDADFEDEDADKEDEGGGLVYCGCKKGCSTKQCVCKKAGNFCRESCSCCDCQNHNK